MSATVVRSLSFPSGELPAALLGLLAEFRLIVNKSIRIALQADIRSRLRLQRAAYRGLSDEHEVYKQYIPSAFEIALAGLKVYRRRTRMGKRTSIPFMRRLMLKAENQSYRLDRKTGRLRIPIRRGVHVNLDLPLSEWHRWFLSDPSWGLGSLIVTPRTIVLAVRREAPEPYEPAGAIALDTNEDSLDGLEVEGDEARLGTLPFGGVRKVQATHFRRRRQLTAKKAGDRRVERRLLAREGARERNRVVQRLHKVSKSLVAAARAQGGRDCPRRPHAPRWWQPLPEDEPPSLLLASPPNPSSNRVQGRARRCADYQGEPSVDVEDLPRVWRAAPR